MTIIPFMGNRIPSDGDWSGNGTITTAVCHPCHPYGPKPDSESGLVDADLDFYKITAPSHLPPISVLSLAYYKSWKVSASLSFGSASISISDEVISFPSGATMGNRLSSFTGPSVSGIWNGDVGDFDLSLLVALRDISYGTFNETTGKWRVPIAVQIDVLQFVPPSTTLSATWGVDISTFDASNDESSVSVTVAGDSIALYAIDSGNDALSVSGSVTIEPFELLPLT